MLTYVVRRLFHALVFLFTASLLIYTFLVILMPGGPSDQAASARLQGYLTEADYPDFPEVTLAYINEHFKVDYPWPLNYFVWLFDPNDITAKAYNSDNIIITVPKGIDLQVGNLHLRGSGILTGDFGEENYSGALTPVGDVISARSGSSLALLLLAFAVTLLVGIPLGIVGAARKGSLLDHSLTVVSLSGIAIPPYALGYLLILFLAVGLKTLHDQSGWSWVPWFPPGSYGTDDIWNQLYHMVLPATALAVPQIARIARHTRFALLDVLNQDYIRTARAKGLRFRRVITKHALRNSLTTIITQIALFVPLYMSAGIAVENVFAFNGLGKTFYKAVGGCIASFTLFTSDPPPCPAGYTLGMDYPIVLAILLLMLLLVAFSNLIADILYVVVDPRISREVKGKTG